MLSNISAPAEMAAISVEPPPHEPRDWTHLTIDGSRDLTSILAELDRDPSLARRVHAIEVTHDIPRGERYSQSSSTSENKAGGVPLEEKIARFSEGVAQVIKKCVSASIPELSSAGSSDTSSAPKTQAPVPGLQTFIWYSISAYTSIWTARPAAFWDALAAAAATLETLSLGFYTHEIFKIQQGGIEMFPGASAPALQTAKETSEEASEAESTYAPFPHLKHLFLELTGGHGDLAAPIEKLLASLSVTGGSEKGSSSNSHSSSLVTLGLELPNCPSEDCQLRGLSYSWTFPGLRRLFIAGSLNGFGPFEDFLKRQWAIHTIVINVDTIDEGEYELSSGVLPRLRALQVDRIVGPADGSGCPSLKLAIPISDTDSETVIAEEEGQVEPGVQNDSPASEDLVTVARPITQLAASAASDSQEKTGFLASIGMVSATLRVLDLESVYWARHREYTALDELFPRLTELRQFRLRSCSVRCSTDRSIEDYDEDEYGEVHRDVDENGNPGYGCPPAPNCGTLMKILRAFPANSKIETVSVSDSRSKPLSDSFLSDIYPGAVPRSLKYIVWGYAAEAEDIWTVTEKKRYKVEREGRGRIFLTECEALPSNEQPVGVPERWERLGRGNFILL